MHTLPPLRRVYYSYLSRMYALARAANTRYFLGITLRGWITLIGLTILSLGLIRNWPLWALGLIVVVLVWLLLSMYLARRANYKRFVPDETSLMSIESPVMLEPNQKIDVEATGSFSVSGYDDNVLHSPAKYWRVPLGDHIVMVETKPGKFLYQFFAANTLQSVRNGWLVSGSQPREALAITFLSKWGPEYTKFQVYDDGQESALAAKAVTIYLSFHNSEDRDAVWQTLVGDARQAREAAV